MSDDKGQRFRYVTVGSDDFTHAQLTVDMNRGRTVCGLPAGDGWITSPATECCADCWADWRVRGDEPRHVGARFGSPGIRL